MRRIVASLRLHCHLCKGCQFGSFAVSYSPSCILMAPSILFPCIYQPSYLPPNCPSLIPWAASLPVSWKLCCKSPWRSNWKRLPSVSVHLQPESDRNLTVCEFPHHRWETEFKTNTLFWWITVNSAQVQAVKMREAAAYVTPLKMKRSVNLSCGVHQRKLGPSEVKKKCKSVEFFLF